MSLKLVNGRGQVGSYIRQMDLTGIYINHDVYVYHTWNVKDKSKNNQKKEYKKFQEFVNKTKSRIIFVSTKTENKTWYTYYKQKAEAYLLLNHNNSVVLRFPTFIGRPCKLFEPNPTPYGEVELISIPDVCSEIIKYSCLLPDSELNIRVINIKGELVSAKLIADILKFNSYE